MGRRLISPVTGSHGGIFDTKTRSPHRTAMLLGTLRASAYVDNGSTRTVCLFMVGPRGLPPAGRDDVCSKIVRCRFASVRRMPNRGCLLRVPRGGKSPHGRGRKSGRVAALVGDTARATILAALMGGQALTGTELAYLAR